jgi:tetratricopeptide (TPR) repeat protein
MRSLLAVTVVVVAAVSFTLQPALAADPVPTKAESVRDDVISKLVGWRTKPAEVELRKKEGLDETQPYLTAQGLLMVTYSLNQDQKTVQRGLEILEAQTKRDPNDPISQYYLGTVLSWLEKPDQAKTAWSRARDRANAMIKKNGRDAAAHFYRGAALVMLKNPGEAQKSLKKAQRYGFDPPMVNFQLGLAYLTEKKWRQAKDAFDEVHAVDPRYAHLYFYRGLAWDKLGRKDQLLIDMDQFVKLAPNSPEAKTAQAILAAVR